MDRVCGGQYLFRDPTGKPKTIVQSWPFFFYTRFVVVLTSVDRF